MGFRENTYCTVWSVEPKNDRMTTVRLSISRKNKDTGEYVQEFSGYVGFAGSAIAAKAARLKERDRIYIKRIDVTNRYDAEAKKEYTNYWCFDFCMADEAQTGGSGTPLPLPPEERRAPSRAQQAAFLEEGFVESDEGTPW